MTLSVTSDFVCFDSDETSRLQKFPKEGEWSLEQLIEAERIEKEADKVFQGRDADTFAGVAEKKFQELGHEVNKIRPTGFSLVKRVLGFYKETRVEIIINLYCRLINVVATAFVVIQISQSYCLITSSTNQKR